MSNPTYEAPFHVGIHPDGCSCPQIATPGSDLALVAGCSCAVLDNAHGRGAWGSRGDTAVFFITEGCPVHDQETR